MSKRSADFWLGIALLLFLISAGAAAVAHSWYARAEVNYQTHLNHIVLTPGHSPSKELAGYAATASGRLWLQAVLGLVTLCAVANVLIQVVRRRNQRVAEVELVD
ncbi:MAG TPA: hypothetical protein VLE99_03990 [Candidatus Saccharimonadales bacterium]|nr:hypothetical protein [Candidatus Saccharimonadales bacterium]